MRLVGKNQRQVIESVNVCKLHMNFPPSSKLIQKVMLLSSNHLEIFSGPLTKLFQQCLRRLRTATYKESLFLQTAKDSQR